MVKAEGKSYWPATCFVLTDIVLEALLAIVCKICAPCTLRLPLEDVVQQKSFVLRNISLQISNYLYINRININVNLTYQKERLLKKNPSHNLSGQCNEDCHNNHLRRHTIPPIC